MPERELPEQLRERLAGALTEGAALVAPSPAQARYATVLTGGTWPVRGRLAVMAVTAMAALVLVALVGPTQPRQWVIQSVQNVARNVGVPIGERSPSPATLAPAASPTEPVRSTPQGTAEPAESPEPTESPEATPTSGGDGVQASPSPEPSDGGGGGADSSPNPEDSPSPTPDASGDGH